MKRLLNYIMFLVQFISTFPKIVNNMDIIEIFNKKKQITYLFIIIIFSGTTRSTRKRRYPWQTLWITIRLFNGHIVGETQSELDNTWMRTIPHQTLGRLQFIVYRRQRKSSQSRFRYISILVIIINLTSN